MLPSPQYGGHSGPGGSTAAVPNPARSGPDRPNPSPNPAIDYGAVQPTIQDYVPFDEISHWSTWSPPISNRAPDLDSMTVGLDEDLSHDGRIEGSSTLRKGSTGDGHDNDTGISGLSHTRKAQKSLPKHHEFYTTLPTGQGGTDTGLYRRQNQVILSKPTWTVPLGGRPFLPDSPEGIYFACSFALHLLKDIRFHEYQSDAQNRLIQCLPALLETFAIRIEVEVASLLTDRAKEYFNIWFE